MASRFAWCGLICASLCCGPGLNAADEDDEFQPGLVAAFRTDEKSVAQVHSDIAFAWDDAAPDPTLPVGPFEASWRGLLLVRQEAKHRLYAFAQGEVAVELDGRRVLNGNAKQPAWIIGEEFIPGLAERSIVVTFRKTEKTAQLKLFWSSDIFGLEPLPAELLFHDQTSFNPNTNGLGAIEKPTADRVEATPEHANAIAVQQNGESIALIERGRRQFAAFRCGRCHIREGDTTAPAGPSLQHVAAGMTAEQIAKRLAPAMITLDATALDRRMPHFRLNDEQARHLAAFLVQQSEPVKLDEWKPPKTKPPKEGEPIVTPQRRGELLLRSVGCLACHRLGEFGNSNDIPFAGPDLTRISARRSQSWLLTWLADPQRLNADHRMPVFSLTNEERHDIVTALKPTESTGFAIGESDRTSRAVSSNPRLRPKTKSNEQSSEPSAKIGQTLFVEHRCAACHRATDPKLNELARPKNDLSRPTDWSTGCLDEQWVSDDARQPIYLRGLDRAAIKAFLASRWDRPLSRESPFVRGTRMLEEKNCFACHPRHGGIGLGRTAKLVASADKELNGQAPSLVAPSLNAIGDKLLDEALSIAVRGERQPIRMPWLKVRMPKFKHSSDELATLTRYFVEHDRIPNSAALQASRAASAPGRSGEHVGGLTPPARQGQLAADAQTHLAGQALTGVRGWSCIACHKIGDYEPKQVALGARGSDLKMLGKHLRPEFFFRWIASPLRVIPGVEMPQYNRPVAGVLDGNLSKQHAALWQALNDPNFQPPTNPANVEQLWVVNPGDRPRIIRDVFQLPKEFGGGTIPRSFAVGFDNGHSLLFDAETASVRQWTFGDFARQQVIGKRWFWEMAGSSVLRDLPATQFAVQDKNDPTRPIRFTSANSFGPMGVFEPTAKGLRVIHWIDFPTERDAGGWGLHESIRVEETLEPFTDKSNPERVGIQRMLKLNWFSEGSGLNYELWFGRPLSVGGSDAPRIECVDGFLEEGQRRTLWDSGKFTWQRLVPRDEPGGQLEWTQLPIKDRKPDSKPRDSKAPSPPLLQGNVTVVYSATMQRLQLATSANPPVRAAAKAAVSSVPGFDGVQLPLDASIMPTGFAWRPNGQLVLSSLKGQVFAANDDDNDQLENRLVLLHEGLCAPYGVLIPEESQVQGALGGAVEMTDRTPSSRGVLVATKSELTLLIDTNGDGYCERQELASSGWGYTDDYHEWTSSPVRDSKGNVFFGLASDYTDKNRPKERSLWRGKILRQKPNWRVPWISKEFRFLDEFFDTPATAAARKEARENARLVLAPVGHSFRYPTGIAINERDEVFVSDQQGVQNCFNEINYLVEGAHYGVPSTHEEDKDAPETKGAIQIPHPWTRSVNGLCFLTGNEGYPDLKGHGIGCEYNGRFLIRFTTQRVGDVMQGAVYPFSRPDYSNADENFQGPLCCGISPKGEIYIGSISDSGWIGGNNTGSIVKLKANGQRPNGIREIRATRDGFDIEFFAPVDKARATNGENYSISGYTRVWGGAYATPDSDRHRCKVLAVELSEDGKTARLKVDSRKTPNYVYDISCRNVGDPEKPFFPSYGFFTLHMIP